MVTDELATILGQNRGVELFRPVVERIVRSPVLLRVFTDTVFESDEFLRSTDAYVRRTTESALAETAAPTADATIAKWFANHSKEVAESVRRHLPDPEPDWYCASDDPKPEPPTDRTGERTGKREAQAPPNPTNHLGRQDRGAPSRYSRSSNSTDSYDDDSAADDRDGHNTPRYEHPGKRENSEPVLRSVNSKYKGPVNYKTYQLHHRSPHYDTEVAKRMARWAKRMDHQLKPRTFVPSDPISVLSFLPAFHDA